MSASLHRTLWKGIIASFLVISGVAAVITLWPKPPFVIGVVNHAGVNSPVLEGFESGLREQGFVSGRDVIYVYDGPTDSVDLVLQQARKYMQMNANMLLALSTPAALAAKEAAQQTQTPVLFAPSGTPVASGLVASLDHPNGYVSGVMFGVQEGKRLEWFVRIVPGAHTLLYPYNPADKSPTTLLKVVRAAADMLKVKIVPVSTPNVEALRLALRNIAPEITGIFVSADALVASHMDMIVAEADAKSLPVSAPHRGGVLDGALMAYGFSLYDVGRQAARLAAQVIGGTSPAELPVQTAAFKLTINIRVARRLGVLIPHDILRQAQLVGG
ncbi:MAG: ABC transporter substrate-binding protein [Magnetovibrio sp.]|nr:ABC transporter substrate-binding protein [Magnetovibrio sp.]